MLGEKGDYSILLYAGLIIVFLLLAMIGSYAIITMTGNHASSNIFPGPVNTTGGGYGLIYLNDSLQWIDGSSPQYAKNGNFSGTANFCTYENYTDVNQWLIMAFVDYNLTPIYYNGNLEKSHRIALQSPGQHNVSFNMTGLQNGTYNIVFLNVFNVSFKLTGLQNGTHNIAFLNVLSPYCNLTGNDINGWNILDCVSGTSFNLVAGNASASTVQNNAVPLEQFVTYKNNSNINLMDDGPWLTEKPFFVDESLAGVTPPTDAISYINAAPGEDIAYYIDVRNGVGLGNEDNSRFTMMQLLDYEQMPLRQDMSEEVYFGALNPGQTLALHADILAPKTPGKHILSIIWMTNPYEVYSFWNIRQIIINVTS